MLKLVQLRADLNITQETLANKLGITRQYVSEIENGKKIPSNTLLCKMANLTGLTYKDFINKYVF